LIYSAIMSLDGYVADEDGNFDWAAPDAEVHTFVNDLERRVGARGPWTGYPAPGRGSSETSSLTRFGG